MDGVANTKNEPMKAVIYCRVSSKAQESEGHGLESQETRCRQYAEAKGYEVAAVFPDTITGGGDFMKRPGMVALLSFLDAQPDERFVVIFDDLKRFARDRDFHFRLRDAFRQRDAQVECLNFKFEETPEGEFIETILAAQGQLERKQNGRQVAQKMQARMENGYWIHTAPIGYCYQTIKGRGKVLVPNPPFDAIIREAFEGFASGRFATQAEVKRFFESCQEFPRNRNGVVEQKRVVDIFTQPVYAGYICSERYKLNWLKAQHEPLISLEVFEKVQERRQGATYAPKRKNIGNDFALRGIATCTCCGAPLRSSWSKGKYRQYAYYLCQTKGCEAYGKSIPRGKLESQVGEIIKTLEPTQGLITVATAMFRNAWAMRAEQAKSNIQAAKQRLRKIEAEIDQILTRIVEATNGAVIRAYETKIADLEKDRARMSETLTKQSPPKHAFDEKLGSVLTKSFTFPACYDSFPARQYAEQWNGAVRFERFGVGVHQSSAPK
ncbi:recombinase family protein [Rhodophyticola sp. CCM32]|uniref:recombinase family protein n=1 Tax=Rhodophyticola sp. CCM32 TaxID=2916397 RepID=UPI00107F212A|nr:recombinase family protein [Rhodophyticola sp. CCM32]QBY01109.1 recombinase family protein [Rhodophyticola sp. CCM32]